jgi:hypothetical protein
MGAGTKILAGCGCLAILATALVVAGLGLAFFWLRGQASGVEAVATWSSDIETWRREANAHPFERRPDGVIAEPRLRAFLDVRRAVHQVYEAHEADVEALQQAFAGRRDPPGLAEILATGGTALEVYGELRLAQAKALAQAGMSEAEYDSIQSALYLVAAVAKAESETGHLPAEAVAKATRRMQEALRAGLEAGQREGLPGLDEVSEAELEQLEEALSRAGTSGSEALAVPPENVALYRRHQADIEKYAMHGLAVLGL